MQGYVAEPGGAFTESRECFADVLSRRMSCSRELCGVRVIPAVDVAVVQVKAARRCDGWAGWPVRLWVYGGSTRRVPGRRGPGGDRAV